MKIKTGRTLVAALFGVLLNAAACAGESEKPLNFLLIVADDLGYLDLGVFGSEIETPNIDQLANEGVVLTNYHTAPMCAPSRAELMSGTDHHLAGQGLMDVNVDMRPGYEGYLNGRVVSLASRLKRVGYHTFMTGKWHLGQGSDQSPRARGFERSFVTLAGGASHYGDQIGVLKDTRAKYREDGNLVDNLPEDFYSSDYYTDKMLEFLRTQENDDKPFFAYLSFTAPHWPIQAPEADVAKQKGRYNDGYDVLRQKRFEAWKSRGFSRADLKPPLLTKDHRAWTDLTPDEQAKSARTMEVYAAMVARMDKQIGRVFDYLRKSGQWENTVVLFQSDNGPDAITGNPAFTVGDNRLDNIGRPGSWAYLGPGWASAGSAQYFLPKSYAGEGGHRVPAIVSAPNLRATQTQSDALIATYDVAPTFLELAGAKVNPASEDEQVLPVTGRSFAALIDGREFVDARGANDAFGREHSGNASIQRGDWKLLWVGDQAMYLGVKRPGPPPMSGRPMDQARFDRGAPAGTPIGSGGPWRLHNLKDDPSEREDLSAQYPDIVQALLKEWDQFVEENGVMVKSGYGDPAH